MEYLVDFTHKMKEWERPNRKWKQSTSESLICNEKLVKTCALSVIKGSVDRCSSRAGR